MRLSPELRGCSPVCKVRCPEITEYSPVCLHPLPKSESFSRFDCALSHFTHFLSIRKKHHSLLQIFNSPSSHYPNTFHANGIFAVFLLPFLVDLLQIQQS